MDLTFNTAISIYVSYLKFKQRDPLHGCLAKSTESVLRECRVVGRQLEQGLGHNLCVETAALTMSIE